MAIFCRTFIHKSMYCICLQQYFSDYVCTVHRYLVMDFNLPTGSIDIKPTMNFTMLESSHFVSVPSKYLKKKLKKIIKYILRRRQRRSVVKIN